MKTYKHLIEYALSDECMDKALNNAIKRKTWRQEVQDLLAHKDEVKAQIREDILNRRLKQIIHRGYRRLDGAMKKERIIVQPYFTRTRPEQWIQHIAIEAVRPIISKGFYFHSCGSVPQKGVHCGKKYLAKYIKKHQKDVRYCLKIDVRKFYQSINTDLLKYKLERIIKDDLMLYLLYWIIDNNVAILDDGSVIAGGLPVGGYPSQYFANFFLQDFDHYLKEVVKVDFYMRYMDDIVILARNKRELHSVLKTIREYLQGLGLELKSNYQVFKFHYINKRGEESGRFIDFMGFKFYRNRTTIRKATFLRACRIARKIGRTKRLTLKRAYKIISYKGWFDSSDSFQAYEKYILKYVSVRKCKELISAESKRSNKNGSNLQNSAIKQKTA